MHSYRSETADPSAILKAALAARQRRNPHYSLRAFAAHLGVPPGRLSELLSRKRSVTRALAKFLVGRLDLAPSEACAFVEGAMPAGRSAKSAMSLARQATRAETPYATLADDSFSAIAEWEHFALLSLLETADAKSDAAWMARRLGIGIGQVRDALERLERLGLVVRESDNAAFRPTHANLSTGDADVSPALRRSHKQSLEHAIRAIDDVPLAQRDVSSVTMAVDIARLPEACALIRAFRRDLAALLETGDRTEVYNLNIQLVPLSNIARRLP